MGKKDRVRKCPTKTEIISEMRKFGYEYEGHRRFTSLFYNKKIGIQIPYHCVRSLLDISFQKPDGVEELCKRLGNSTNFLDEELFESDFLLRGKTWIEHRRRDR